MQSARWTQGTARGRVATLLRPPTRLAALLLATLPSTAAAFPLDGVRPPSAPGALESWSAPVAVHAPVGTPADAFTGVLADAERALAWLVRDRGYPDPLPDGTRGGSASLDVYLVRDPRAPDARCVVDVLDTTGAWDRASAFVEVRAGLDGAQRAHALTEALAEALLLGIDARPPEPWRRGLAHVLAAQREAHPPDTASIAITQSQPWRQLFRADDPALAPSASLFFQSLATRFDAADGRLLRGLSWMPVGHTPWDAPGWSRYPDGLLALERLLRDQRGGLAGYLLDFAVQRYALGTRGDLAPLVGWTEDSSVRPHVVRRVPLADLPEWVVSDHPLDVLGTAYVVMDVQAIGRPRPEWADVWLHGSPYRKWMATAVQFSAAGVELARVPLAPVERGEWSASMLVADDTREVVVVLVDLGAGRPTWDEFPDPVGWFAVNLAAHGTRTTR